MVSTHGSTAHRWPWVAGIVFVVALVAEAVISVAIPIDQNDSATKIAHELAVHQDRLLVVAGLSVVYAAAFPIWLAGLHQLLRGDRDAVSILPTLVLVGGVLLVALHAVSDVAIVGLLGADVAEYAAAHNEGISYTLYLLTFAIDSVGDVFGSLFAVAAGLLILERAVLPRWLGWMAIAFGILLLVQGPMLGGVVITAGVIVDGLGFVLFLLFVLVTSIMSLRR
jgi:hypothetical protein